MAWAVLATVIGTITNFLGCCCMPLALVPGGVAIYFSSQVNSLLAAGDLAGAQRASNNAKLWAWVTTGLAILGAVMIVLSLFINLSGMNEQWLDELRRQGIGR
jgi:hypothetical protein